MLDTEAAGLACYSKEPGDSDVSRERIGVSTFAGLIAQQRPCKERSYPLRGCMEIILSPDWIEALRHYEAVPVSTAPAAARLECRRRWRVSQSAAAERNWNAIRVIAKALPAKDWEPVKELKSGSQRSTGAEAEYGIGEVAAMLAQHGIRASVSKC